MISTQKGEPALRLIEEIFKLAIDDIRYQNPTACCKWQRESVKASAEAFFKTKFYFEMCEMFNLPAEKAAKTILSQKNIYLQKEINEELENELPQMQHEVQNSRYQSSW